MKKILLLFLILLSWFNSMAQELKDSVKKPQPSFKLLREDEDYHYLADANQYAHDFFDPIKFLPLNTAKTSYLSFGGEFRPRYEFFRNNGWGKEADDQYGNYSERLALNSSLVLGRNLRFYGELYHGLTTHADRPEISEDDQLDIHQAFVDIILPNSKTATDDLTLRVGRQEMIFGSSRLFGLRDGPNIRRSFDAARIIFNKPRVNMQAFFGSEVNTYPGVFDNSYNKGMRIWGIWTSFQDPTIDGHTEFYYYGFRLNNAVYNAGVGKEDRQTLGVRRYGNLGDHFYYNSELMYQFGTFARKTINALAVEFDYHYQIKEPVFFKDAGLKFDYISGDRNPNDNQLNTFNPLFSNPSYYGLLSAITPINLIDIHPSLQFRFSEKSDLVIDWDFFWRASLQDGVYKPPRVLVRSGLNARSRYIGNQPAAEVGYEFSRHLKLSLESSYFLAGSFLAETGPSKNIFYIADTFTYTF